MIDYRADVIGRQIRALRGRSDNWERIYELLVEAGDLDNAGWNEWLQRYPDLKPLLQDFALAAFDDREVHDASSMSYWLAGQRDRREPRTEGLPDSRRGSAWCARSTSLIEKDTHGWYHRVEDHERDTVG
jgi:hypothetical protein